MFHIKKKRWMQEGIGRHSHGRKDRQKDLVYCTKSLIAYVFNVIKAIAGLFYIVTDVMMKRPNKQSINQ